MFRKQVVYSIGARFAGGGIGNTAYHGVRGLYRQGMLHRLLCGSYRGTEIDNKLIRSLGVTSRLLRKLAVYDPKSRLTYIHNRLYDLWSRHQLEPCAIFLTWNGFGLEAMSRAKEQGSITTVYRASAHVMEQVQILEEEYTRWRREFMPSRRLVNRSVAELEEADYVVIPSDFVRDSFIRHGFDTKRLIQIPFGVDAARFHPPPVAIEDDPFRVLFVGQVGFQKGVPYLLQAWKRLQWDNAELWLVGRVAADFREYLEGFRDLKGLHIVGHLPDPGTNYRKAHLFVFPSLQEGSALVVYEAMASELPVITTPNAGSVIRDGQDGYLVPIRDAEMLAEQMDVLRADSNRRREIGKAARVRIEPYSWERYGNSLAAALTEKVVANG